MNTEVAKDFVELVNGLKGLVKSKAVKYKETKFDYIPLDDILERVKQNGKFAVIQPLSNENGLPIIETILVHESGEQIVSGKFPLFIQANAKPQDMGSVITYTRRYSLSSFLGIASETDNDANPESEVISNLVKDDTLIKLLNATTEAEQDKMLSFYNIKTLGQITEANAQKLLSKKGVK